MGTPAVSGVPPGFGPWSLRPLDPQGRLWSMLME
jgi:hypothetical protein